MLSLNLKRYFTFDLFCEGLKVAISAILGQLTRDLFRPINA